MPGKPEWVIRSCLKHTAQKGGNKGIITASGRKLNHRKGGAVLMELVGGTCTHTVHSFFFMAGYMLGWDVDTTQCFSM